MTDLSQRFRSLDRTPAPDLWSEVVQRAAVPEPPRSWGFPTMNRLAPYVLLATAVVVLLIGIGLLVRPNVGPPSTPRPTPTPLVLRSATAAWIATDEMSVGRADHTATLLADGRVLVAGGRGPNVIDPLATAELFDPGTGSWSPAADMLIAHEGHTATLLLDGRVLVVGEEGSELYDAESDTWRATDPVTSPSTATLLADGRVLVTAATAPRAQVYDPADDSWIPTGPMLTPRYNHVATLLPDGSVLVAGGDVPPDVGLVAAERYDPATNSWTATGDSARPPRSHTVTLLPDGRALDVGWALGDVVFGELYDPETGTWSGIDLPVPLPYSARTAPLLNDGSVLFVSIDGSSSLYDSATGSWTTGPRMALGRFEPTVTLLLDGRVLVVGGVDGRLSGFESHPGLSSAELYDPGTGQ
jgi:Galactose oxidase, central domain